MRHAQFETVTSECTPDVLVIRDVGPWDEFPTVTNDAEYVVRACTGTGALFPKGGPGRGARLRRLWYYDSDGELGELRHDCKGKFLGFAPVAPLAAQIALDEVKRYERSLR
jgi:hypothetical protein